MAQLLWKPNKHQNQNGPKQTKIARGSQPNHSCCRVRESPCRDSQKEGEVSVSTLPCPRASELLTSGRSGSAVPPGWARRSAGSARSLRPRCFCSLPPRGSAGRSSAGGCVWNWRHLAPWGCLGSLNNAGKGNKISFNCTGTKPEFLFIITRCFCPKHLTVKYWSEAAILILPGQNFWVKLDNFSVNIGCLP